MKTIKNLLLLPILLCSSVSYSQESPEFSTGCISDDCLLCYLSLNIESDQVKNLISSYDMENDFQVWTSEKRGIKIETDENSDITEIIIYDLVAFNDKLPFGLTASSTLEEIVDQLGNFTTDDYGGHLFLYNSAIQLIVYLADGEDNTLYKVRYSLRYGYSMSESCFESGLEEYSSLTGSDEYAPEYDPEYEEEDVSVFFEPNTTTEDQDPITDDSDQNSSLAGSDAETFESVFNKVILTAPKNFANADSYSFPDYGKGLVYSNEFYLFLEVYDSEDKAAARIEEFDEFIGKQKTPCCGFIHELDALSLLTNSVDIVRLPAYVADGYDAALNNLRIVTTYRIDENTGKFQVLLIMKNTEE